MSSSPGAALSNLAGGRDIVRPGAGLIRAAQPLASPKRAEGEYPSQWLWPGPNSKMAKPNGAVAIPAIVAPATTAQATILTYEVPEGFRFVLTRIALGAFASDWTPGSGQLLFTALVEYSTGPRKIEFLQSLPFGLGVALGGGIITEELDGRLEFEPLAVLQCIVFNSGIPTPNAADFAFAVLNGFIYPTSESA